MHNGYIYYNGKGVEIDYSKALEWFLKADIQHHALAQYMIGHMYYDGIGVEIDKKKSVE